MEALGRKLPSAELSATIRLAVDFGPAQWRFGRKCQAQFLRHDKLWRCCMSTKPSIVFAHGLWADGSCFSKVIRLLQSDGYEVIATQNQLNTVADDVAAVRTALGRVSSPAVLVGHSYGGTVITAAGTDDRVAAIVYICALAPDDGETSQAEQDKYPKTPVFQHIEVADGRIWVRPSGIPDFAGDLPEDEQKLVWATQTVPLADLFNQPVPGAAWKSKPTYYIVGANDRTVQPDLQRFVAKRMNAKITELQSSHVPMLSQPQRVYEVIRDAAEAVARAATEAEHQVPTPA
jgi:pimeloyl-ACP methyl ester carboxylesterase